jgi:hypothetical protein
MLGITAVTGKTFVGQDRPDFPLKIDTVLRGSDADKRQTHKNGKANESAHESGSWHRTR